MTTVLSLKIITKFTSNSTLNFFVMIVEVFRTCLPLRHETPGVHSSKTGSGVTKNRVRGSKKWTGGLRGKVKKYGVSSDDENDEF